MDHIEHSRGHEWAFKGDVAYNFLNDSFLKQVKFGARYADREQDIKYTTYNWGSLSEVWAGRRRLHGPGRRAQKAMSRLQLEQFLPRRHRRRRLPRNFYNGNLISGYDDAVAFFQSVQASAQRGGPCRLRLRRLALGPACSAGRASFQARRSCRAKSRTSGRRPTMPMRCFASARTNRSSATSGSTATSASGSFTTI